jgi:CelD/BcsL family acetyltransferase involved in cellulose biosynthesis
VYTVSELTTVEGFRALRNDWAELVAKNESLSVFVTWEWLFSWWEMYGQSADLLILVARNDAGEICGIAPLYVNRASFGRGTIGFIGDHSVASDYLQFVCRTVDETPVSRAFYDHLAARRPRNPLRFYQLPEGSGTARAVSERVEGLRLHSSPVEQQPSVYIALPDTFDKYLARLSQNGRHNLRKHRKRLDAAGGYAFSEEADRWSETFGEFERLHNARMQATGRVTNFAAQAFRQFHLLVAERSAERGWLRLYFLRRNGQAVAALYGFTVNNKFYFYNSGFDPAFSDHHVGAALMGLIVERCIQDGLGEFDFLSAGEYKERWAVEERQKQSFLVSQSRRTIDADRMRRRARTFLSGGLRQMVPASAHQFLRNQRKQLLLLLNRPVR